MGNLQPSFPRVIPTVIDDFDIELRKPFSKDDGNDGLLAMPLSILVGPGMVVC